MADKAVERAEEIARLKANDPALNCDVAGQGEPLRARARYAICRDCSAC